MSGPAGRSARRPPPLVSATSAPGRAARIRSANRLPSGDSTFWARLMGAVTATPSVCSRCGARGVQRGGDGRLRRRRRERPARLRSVSPAQRSGAQIRCGGKMRASTARPVARSTVRSTRLKARPLANASTMGMPETRWATPSWVWPATMASSTAPLAGSSRATWKISPSGSQESKCSGVVEALADAAGVGGGDDHRRAPAGVARRPPRRWRGPAASPPARRSWRPASCAACWRW